jgi:hypothetical protein
MVSTEGGMVNGNGWGWLPGGRLGVTCDQEHPGSVLPGTIRL